MARHVNNRNKKKKKEIILLINFKALIISIFKNIITFMCPKFQSIIYLHCYN